MAGRFRQKTENPGTLLIAFFRRNFSFLLRCKSPYA